MLENLIKSYVYKIHSYYRDDLYQEILIKIYNVIDIFKINLNILYEINIELVKNIKERNYYKILNEKYVNGYEEKYGDMVLVMYQNEKIQDSELILELSYFCNENQFINYINKSINSAFVNFVRNKKLEYNINIKRERRKKNKIEEVNYLELLDQLFLKYNLLDEEKKFLKMFIENNKLISEKTVGRKLGISQQAVNKRKKKITNKLKLD